MKTCNTILGFKYFGEIKNGELAYAWCRGQIPEHEELALISCFLPHTEVFFDIGANSGAYCVLATALGKGNIHSYAFEPQTKCINDLNETVKANKWENILSVNKVALSNKNGVEKIYFDKNISTGTSLVNKTEDFFEIETIKLDDYCQNNKVKKIDFIKIDVEGFELEVLHGGEEVIKSSEPAIYIEILNGTTTKEKTIDFLLKHDYKLYILHDSKLVKFEKNQKFNNIDMYLCLKEKHNNVLNDIENLLMNNRLLFEPFRQSSLSMFNKYFNYNLLKMRYFLRSFVK